ncbi:hypothetical protein ATE92_1065 [Ulvibacter sp. MAR_2010_11]|uniref:hypothetical protein n=1 Tax=Ulvibacter sp. MAR_2010_11 TaxID=1250229 RepID=UPI000C2C8DAB|nr:hypothetical protein [Ulvibacter sp. MAR_2010_11]PKA82924.1 hypothetical protein ATE92_1065 [Ulvibacter sp. MAR_2010_11]
MNTTNNNEDIDLIFLFKKLNDSFKRILIAAYKFILFLIRNWIIVLSLVLIGILWGYLSQKDVKNSKSTNAVVRINFGLGSYVYNSIDILNTKINNRDSVFLSNHNLWNGQPLIKNVEIKPIISFNELLENYGNNNKTFEILLDKYEYDGDDSASKVFTFEYKFHKLKVKLSNNATSKTLDNLINYFNGNELLASYKEEAIKTDMELLLSNKKTIELIDKVFQNYVEEQEPDFSTYQIVLDKDLTGLVEKKNHLLDLNKDLQRDIELSKDITVLLNKSDLVEQQPGILGNKIIVYPFFLLFMFFVFALFRKGYSVAKEMTLEERKNA